MDPHNPVGDVILFFKGAYAIILALALAEAFKQFVHDKAHDNPNTSLLHWDRLPALISFLVLIVPFFHGMTRYLFETYADTKRLPNPYSLFLMVDGAAFMAEAAIFFVMSRALAPVRWFEFYCCIMVLLFVDSLWASTTSAHGVAPGDPNYVWGTLNLLTGGVVAALLLFFRGSTAPLKPALVGAALMTVRTAVDYGLMWNSFYFPAAS